VASGGDRPRYEPLTGHDERVRAVAVGQLDGRPVIVSGGFGGTVRSWDARTGAPGLLIDLGSVVRGLALSSVPPRLVVSTSQGLIVIDLSRPGARS